MKFRILFAAICISLSVFAQNIGIYPPVTATGTDTYVSDYTGINPAPTTYVNNTLYRVKFNNANLTTTPTWSFNSLASHTLTTSDGAALTVGAIKAGDLKIVSYDGTNFRIMGGGASTWGSIGGTLSDQTDLQTALGLKADKATTVNGHALSSNVTIVNSDIEEDATHRWATDAEKTTWNAKQAALVSGTNIRTVENNTLLGSTNIDLGKSDVGLSNVDNTSDASKPVSTAQQTALDLKANINSQTFTGTPTLPTGTIATTQSAGNSTAALATTAFVTTKVRYYGFAASDNISVLTTGNTKGYITLPFGFTVTGVAATLLTAQTSGSLLTIDLNEAGVSILSTKLTIDNNEKDSSTAATAAVISDSSIAAFAQLTADFDVVGTGGFGVIIWIYGY